MEHLQFQQELEKQIRAHLSSSKPKEESKKDDSQMKELISGMLKLSEEVIRLKNPIKEKPKEVIEEIKEEQIPTDEVSQEIGGVFKNMFKKLKRKKKNA